MANALNCYGILPLVWPKGSYSTQLHVAFQNDVLDLVDNKDF